MELTPVRDELFVEDDFLTFEEVFDLETELDFILFEEELLAGDLVEDELFDELPFEDLLEMTLVILPRVVLVLLGFVVTVVFGMFLSSSSFFFISGLVIVTLSMFSDSAIFFDGV